MTRPIACVSRSFAGCVLLPTDQRGLRMESGWVRRGAAHPQVRKRMAAAQRMLYEVGLRPIDIAEAVGYPDIYQFSKQFKNPFGVSPTA